MSREGGWRERDRNRDRDSQRDRERQRGRGRGQVRDCLRLSGLSFAHISMAPCMSLRLFVV